MIRVFAYGELELSDDDRDKLDMDALLYGNAYVEVFESGRAVRIPPKDIHSGRVTIARARSLVPTWSRPESIRLSIRSRAT